MDDNLYKDFFDPSEEFRKEPRYFCYELALNLVTEAKRESKGDDWYEDVNTIKGILLLLFTWNFAARETKKLNFENVGKTLQECRDDLRELETYTIENMDKNAEEKIKKVFCKFKKTMGQTEASKALSLLNPKLFVMWDTQIRKRLRKQLIKGIENGEKAEHYIIFLKGIKSIICQYKLKEKLPKDAIVAKKVDEYNYVKIVMNKTS